MRQTDLMLCNIGPQSITTITNFTLAETPGVEPGTFRSAVGCYAIDVDGGQRLISSSSCNNNWTPNSVDTWKTPLRLDLTAAHSIVAPFKSTHNSGLLVPVDDPAAVVDIFALHENWKFKLMK
jgi:hypothetical protein